MSITPPLAESFQEIFCAQYGVPTELYGATMLRLTLYPHARWLAAWGRVEYLAPDRRFVAGVGRLTRWGGFAGEVREFQHAPANCRFGRRRLRLRVSVGRMRSLFSEVMGQNTSARRNEAWSRDETRDGSGSFVAE